MRPFALFLAVVLLGTLLSGCVTPIRETEPPRLQLDLQDEVFPQNRPFTVQVRFENTADEAFLVEASDGCIRVDVWVRVRGAALPLDPPLQQCPDATESVRVEPGESREWGPYRFHPGEYRQGGEAVFQPGEAYTIVAEIPDATGWDVQNETRFKVSEPIPDPTMEIEPENQTFTQGETIAITARFTNPGNDSFTYTSRDGCNDIHVYVVDAGEDGNDLRLWPDMEPYACTQALTEFTIEAGGSLEVTVHWDGSADGEGGPPYADADSYLLAAKLDGREDHPTAHVPVALRAPEE